MLAPAAAYAAGPAQPAQQEEAAASVDASYLHGRWCEENGAWMSIDRAAGQINLPNGNSGQRVVGSYTLAGSELSITGPAGARVKATVRRIDDRSMHIAFGEQSSLVRRC
jgi:hypothetical protein